MMGSYYYPKSTPRAVKDGITIKSRRGAIGEQWWSKHFLDALNRIGMENRLARGKRYARKGQVVSIDILNGAVHAAVQGSMPRPYRVTIRLREWDEDRWKVVISQIAGQALYAAELLAGEMPHEIEEVVQKAGVHLFPVSGKDLDTDCDCPDYANPCKHIAAVYYILAERFDADPFLLFAMRGMEKDDLLEGLRRERGVVGPGGDAVVSPGEIHGGTAEAPPVAAGFYDLRASLDDFELHLTAGPEVKGAMIRRMGQSPLCIGKKNLSDLIAPVYEFGPEYVRRIVHGDDNPDE